MEGSRLRFWMGWLVAVTASGALVAGAPAAPSASEGVRAVLMEAYSAVCHQLPSRTLHIDGHPMAACARCYGIYWGFFCGALLFLGARRWDEALYANVRVILLVCSVPLAIDWGVDIVGIWANTAPSRLSTGAIFGLPLGYLIGRAGAQILK